MNVQSVWNSLEFLLESKWHVVWNTAFKKAFYVEEVPRRFVLRVNDFLIQSFDSCGKARSLEFILNSLKRENRKLDVVLAVAYKNFAECTYCGEVRKIVTGNYVDVCIKCCSKIMKKHSRTIFINSKKMMWFFGDHTNVWNNSMFRLAYKGYVYMSQKHNISLRNLTKEKYPYPPEFRKKYAALKKRYAAKIVEHNSYTTQKGRTIKEFDYPQLYEKEITEINRKIADLKCAALLRGERTIRPFCKVVGKKNRKRGKPVKILKRPYESQWTKYEREKQQLLAKIHNIENNRKHKEFESGQLE